MQITTTRLVRLGTMLCALLIMGVVMTSPVGADSGGGPAKIPVAGKRLPEIELTAPQDPQHIRYLDLKSEDRFKVSRLKADVLIIQIFSMY